MQRLFVFALDGLLNLQAFLHLTRALCASP